MNLLYIDEQIVVLSNKTSIKIIDENAALTQSGKYTYDIEIPNIPSNCKILGHVNRMDVSKNVIKRRARLFSNNRLIIDGTATITAIDDSVIKIQILSGNAEINFLSKKKELYIDELDLGGLMSLDGSHLLNKFQVINEYCNGTQEDRYNRLWGLYPNNNQVFLPIYNQSEARLYNNLCLRKITPSTEGVDWPRKFYGEAYPIGINVSNRQGVHAMQPYLCFIIRKVFEKLGYNILVNDLEKTPLKQAIIANSRMETSYNKVLPHWTVAEFISQLEHLGGVNFKINDATKELSILKNKDFYEKHDNEYIDRILDEYSVTIDGDNTTDISNSNISYSFANRDKYLQLDKEIFNQVETKVYDSYESLLTDYSQLSDSDKRSFIYQTEGKQYIHSNEGLKEVNQFRDLIRNPDSDSNIELKIVPVRMSVQKTKWEGIEYNDFFKHYYPTQGVDFDCVTMLVEDDGYTSDMNQNVQDLIENGVAEPSNKDVLEIAINDGILQRVSEGGRIQKFPWAFVLTHDLLNGEVNRGFSFELNEIKDRINMKSIVYGDLVKLNTQSEVLFRFISDKILDPTKRFIIKNKAFVCKKIEYRIEESGINPEKLGYFFELLE